MNGTKIRFFGQDLAFFLDSRQLFVPPEVGGAKLFTLVHSKRALVVAGCCLVLYNCSL